MAPINHENAIERRLHASAARLAGDYRTSFERNGSNLPGMMPPGLFEEMLAGCIVSVADPSASGCDRPSSGIDDREMEDAQLVALTLISRWGDELSSEKAAWELAIVASTPRLGRHHDMSR